jgi:hypothetical protein
MNYQCTIQISEEHIKYASSKLFFKIFGISILIWCLLSLEFLTVCIFTRRIDVLNGVLLGFLVFWAIFIVAKYNNIGAKKLERFRRQGGQINYEFSEDILKVKSVSGAAELKWETFNGLSIFSKVWLLFSRDGGYLTFPVDQISNDIKEFLKRKIISVSGKIK